MADAATETVTVIIASKSGHMLNDARLGVRIPANPEPVEMTVAQHTRLRADCRVLMFDEMPEVDEQGRLVRAGRVQEGEPPEKGRPRADPPKGIRPDELPEPLAVGEGEQRAAQEKAEAKAAEDDGKSKSKSSSKGKR